MDILESGTVALVFENGGHWPAFVNEDALVVSGDGFMDQLQCVDSGTYDRLRLVESFFASLFGLIRKLSHGHKSVLSWACPRALSASDAMTIASLPIAPRSWRSRPNKSS